MLGTLTRNEVRGFIASDVFRLRRRTRSLSERAVLHKKRATDATVQLQRVW